MIVKTHSVFCDGRREPQGDGTGCHTWIAEADSTAEARKVARRAGWKRVDGLDLCPYCARVA